MFEAFDLNQDGKVERWELQSVLQRVLNSVLTDDEINRLFDQVDANRDGRISVLEFVDFISFEQSRVGQSNLMDWGESYAENPLPGEAPLLSSLADSPGEAPEGSGPPLLRREISMPAALFRERSSTGVDTAKLLRVMSQVETRVAAEVGIDASQAVLLLMHAKWDSEVAIELCRNDRAGTLTAAGVAPAPDVVVPRGGQVCCVCFCDEAEYCLPCGHGLCSEDWPLFLKNAMDTGTVDGQTAVRLKCPGEQCSLLIPRDRFERFLSPEDYDRYTNLLTLSFVNDGDNVCQCPKPDCDLYVVSRSTKHHVTCQCGHDFCFHCGQMPHHPAACSEAQRWLQMLTDTVAIEGVDTKTCPNPDCAVPSFKVDGCHYINCPRCRCNWCWMCGQWGGGPHNRPEPHHVFTCNNKINSAWAAGMAHGVMFGLIRERYDEHLNAAKIAAEALQAKGDEIIGKMGGDLVEKRRRDTKLIKDAVKVLVACRKEIAWTWVRIFFNMQGDEDNARKRIMKQGENFERHIETFNTMLSHDWFQVGIEEHGLDDVASSILEARVEECQSELSKYCVSLTS